jgi:regulator of protease activity HflC (stomatin/prohibitin superfamily)
MPKSPQIVLALAPNGRIYAESVAQNGSRVKVGDWSTVASPFPPEIIADLLAQRDRQRAADAATLRAQQRNNHAYVRDTIHAPALAARIWPEAETRFRHALARKQRDTATNKRATKRASARDLGNGEVMDI